MNSRSIWLLSQKQKRGPNPRVAVAVMELWRGKQKGQSVAVDSSANQRYGHLTSRLKTSTRSARDIKRVSHVHNPIGLKLTTPPLTSTHPSPPTHPHSHSSSHSHSSLPSHSSSHSRSHSSSHSHSSFP